MKTFIFVALFSCGHSPKDTANNGFPGPNPHSMDDVLTLSDVQAIGTHNSTHIQPEFPMDPSHYYTHSSLTDQLTEQGVRQFELDVHLHTELGFQVFHLPLIDAETRCLQLTDCLAEIMLWSNANPWHMPVMIWIEPKDEDLDFAIDEYEMFAGRHDELEQVILSVIPRSRILTPDELRGDQQTLPEAITAKGWPSLGEMRGRFVFAMLDDGEHRDAYLQDSDRLENRLMFVHANTAKEPYSALFKINDAEGNADWVQTLVADGFLVTSNLKDGPEYSETEALAHLTASLAAGAHFLSSDRPAPAGGSDWFSAIPDGEPANCNPITSPPECRASEIENLP